MDVGENQLRALVLQFLQEKGVALGNNERDNYGDLPMLPKFISLDEATHHLYLEGKEGPIRCQVDGSVWEVWQDGRSRWVCNSEVA